MTQSKLNAASTKAKISEIFSNAKIEEGYLDPYTIRSVPIIDIVSGDFYNKVVDWSCIFQTIFSKFNDYKDGKQLGEQLSPEQVSQLVEITHDYLKSLPIEHHFLLPLPRDFPYEKPIDITKSISILRLTKPQMDEYTEANPVASEKGLASILSMIREQGISQNLPNETEVYLKIICSGYVGNGEMTLYGLDPIHIYKVFFALNSALGNLKHDRSPKNPYVDQFAQYAFRAYSKDCKFVSGITRPNDEAKLINGHVFGRKAKDKEMIQAIELMSLLMTDKPKKGSAALQNQVVNSLFWYFEMKKTANPNLQTVFFTSVFDSFFNEKDKSIDKARIISIECSDTAQRQVIAYEGIMELYSSRNKIIHGERSLLDYHIAAKKVNENERARVEVAITLFYNRFLTAKLNRFAKSVK